MIRSQQINFHLSTDETIFGQIVRLEDRSFGAQITAVVPRHKSQLRKEYEWLKCSDAKTATAVFSVLVGVVEQRCVKGRGRRLVMVSNPEGWLLLGKADLKAVVGVDVSVVAEAPLGLV